MNYSWKFASENIGWITFGIFVAVLAVYAIREFVRFYLEASQEDRDGDDENRGDP